MRINIPDDPRYQSMAAAAGYANVERYVQAMLNTDVSELAEPIAISDEQWENAVRSFQSICKSGNPHFDDSRASIYRDRL